MRRAAAVIAFVVGVYAVATTGGRRRLKRAREVYAEEVRSGAKPIEAVGTAVAAFVGLAEGGVLPNDAHGHQPPDDVNEV